MILENLTREKLELCEKLLQNIQSTHAALDVLEQQGADAEQLAFHRLDACLFEREKLLAACGRCEQRLAKAAELGEMSSPEYDALLQRLEQSSALLVRSDEQCTARFNALRVLFMDKLKHSNQTIKSVRAYKLEQSTYVANTSSLINVNI